MLSQLPFSETNLEAVKEIARKFYFSTKFVRCPALENQVISFTSEGLNHLYYKNTRPRISHDQFMRLKVLDLAKKLLEITTTIQEKEEIIQDFDVKINKKRQKISKSVKYFGFIAILENKKIKVIVRKVRDGQLQFWSIIPFWKTTKHGDIKFADYSTGELKDD